MRLLSTLGAAVVVATLALAACNSNDPKGNKTASSSSPTGTSAKTAPSNPAAHVAPADGVKRMTTIELRDALDKGTALVVDVRGADAYAQNHIKGSVNIPLEQMPARLSELPRDKTLVTYCS